MIRSKSLVSAQRLFADLTQGKVGAYTVESCVERMLHKLEQARKDGQPDLSIQALDVTGKKSAEEVEAAIAGLEKDATFERGINHVRHILDNIQEAIEIGSASSGHSHDYAYKNMETALRKVGANTDIFTRGHQPALSEIDALLKGYEDAAIAKRVSMGKTGQAR